MQANHWADLLTTTTQESGDALRAFLAACATSVVAVASSTHRQRLCAHRQQRRRPADARPNAQRPYARPHYPKRLHAERTHEQRPDARCHAETHQRGPCYPQGGQSAATNRPGSRPRPALGANTPPTRHQATSVEGPCKGAPRSSRPAMGEVTLGEPEREESFSPAAPCNCPAQRQDVTYLLRE